MAKEKYQGEAIWTLKGTDKSVRLGTHQCCHCGKHWVAEPGSGKIRGFCSKCNGFVCGPRCAECTPYQKQLDIWEGNAKPDQIFFGQAGFHLGER